MPGRPADLIVIDAPVGGTTATAVDALAAGDTPGIAAVIVDGEVQLTRSRVTPPPIRPTRIVG
jgi:enamidase